MAIPESAGVFKLSHSKVIGIILARLDSIRLPGKALRQVNQIPLIQYAITRSLNIVGLDDVVLATTSRETDQPLVDYAESIRLKVYRGETNNVAQRCLSCARALNADYFLRINGDSPFIDTQVVERGLSTLQAHKPDLVTNLLGRTFPYGVAVEIVKVATFERIIFRFTNEQSEHVTPYFYQNWDEFDIQNMVSDYPELAKARMVVDDAQDLMRFESVLNRLGSDVFNSSYDEIARLYLHGC